MTVRALGRHWAQDRPRRPRRVLRVAVAGLLTVALVGAGWSDSRASARPDLTMTWQAGEAPVEAVAGGVNLSSSVEQRFASMAPRAQAALMDQVRAAGATWIRIAMPMPGDEYSRGNFTWYSDTEVKAALAAGLHVDGLVGWPATWARNADGSPNLADWATFAETVAQHYSPMGVTTFELWNEPNTSTQWGSTGVDIQSYADLLRTVYPVIKAADPTDNVMVGGLAPVGDAADRSTYSPLTFLTDLYHDGAGGYFDSVGFHPYSFPDLPAQSAYFNPWTYLPQIHAVMDDHGDGAKKVWLTEFGAPVAGNTSDVSLDAQGVGYEQAFAIARGWSWAGPIFAYSWIDWDGDGTGHYGLHSPSGAARPALGDFERAIAARLTLRSTAGVPTLRWRGGPTLSGTATLSWSIAVTGPEALGYRGWSEAVDGQAVLANPTSSAPTGSISASTLGSGVHTVVISLYFADGSMSEVLGPLVHVTG